MARQYIGTITEEDFKNREMRIPHNCNCNHCGVGRKYEVISLPIGGIQKIDIGKRVYRIDGVIQVENNEQRDARLAREEHERQLCHGLDRGRTGRL